MRVKTYFFTFFLSLCLLSQTGKANHVWGGELEAICTGGNNYTLRLTQYIDCGRVSGISSTQTITAYSTTGFQLASFNVNLIIKDSLPIIPNPCAKILVGTCIGRVVWEGTATIPVSATDIVLSYSSCCRNFNINNLSNPSSAGQVYTIELPGTNKVAGGCNSSPNFNALPPSEICTNMPASIDFSASDNDGDSLSYSFFTPYGSPTGSYYGGPPFPVVNFEAPYTFDNPMNSGLAIDAETGIISGIPKNTGLFTLGVVVEEFRDGVSIGKKVRDFTYTVVQCAPDFSVGEPQVFTCMNDPVQFSFNFDGTLKSGTTPIWDFGDPTSGINNTSTLTNPTHQYGEIGQYIATVQIEDSCGNVLNETIEVNITESNANIAPPLKYCIGETANVISVDIPCNLTEWYLSDTAQTPEHIGCEFDFPMTQDSITVFFEPFVDPNQYSVGGVNPQGWGTTTSYTATFDAISDITIKSFKTHGDQYWSGCSKYNSTITIEQGGNIIAGPEFVTLNCSGETTISNLNFSIPAGTGYELKVGGATLRAATGGPVSQIGLIDFLNAGPFYDVVVQSNKKCARRDSVVIYSKPKVIANLSSTDTTVCLNSESFIIQKTDSTSLGGTWSGLLNTDSLFTPSQIGTVNIVYSTNGNANTCGSEDTVLVTVLNQDTINILDNQGPFCITDSSTILQLDPITTTGGRWYSFPLDKIDTLTGEVNFSDTDTGLVKVYHTVLGSECPAIDSLVIDIEPNLLANIKTGDTSMCQVASDFDITLTDSSSALGIWSGTGLTGNKFSPTNVTPDTYAIIYTTNGVNQTCSNADTIEVEITPYTVGDIKTSDTSICHKSLPFNIQLTDSTTTGGIWKGIISDAGEFDPNNPPGDYLIKYVVGGGTPCSDSDSIVVTIIAPDTAVITPNQGPYCIMDNNPLIVLDANSTAGGNWSIDNNGIINNATGQINLSGSGSGDFKVSYTTQNPLCPTKDSIQVQITPFSDAEILNSDTSVCLESNAFEIRLINNGGTLSGAGISGTNFSPLTAGIGTHRIDYITAGLNANCSDTDSVIIEVIASDTVEIIPNGPFCALAGNDTMELSINSNGNGTWSSSTVGLINAISGELNINLNNVGKHDVIFSSSGTLCPTADTIEIEIIGIPNAIIATNDTTICDASTPFPIKLMNNSIQTGVWSGQSLTGNTFSPANLSPGDYTIFYTTSGIHQACNDTDSVSIEILPNQTATLAPPVPKLCTRDSAIFVTTLDTTNGGTWWTTPAGYISTQGRFEAQTTPPGDYSIHYGIPGLCGDTSTVNLTVFPVLNPTIDSVPPLCEIARPFNLTAANVGTWNINGNYSNQTFNPIELGPGLHQITNSINDNCPVTDTTHIEVVKNPNSTITSNLSEGCIPLTIKFKDLTDSLALNTSWTIYQNNDSIYSTNSIDSLQHTFSDLGCYDIRMRSTYNFGCASETTLPYQICTYNPPIADFNFYNTPFSMKDPLIYAANNSLFSNNSEWKFDLGRAEINNYEDLILNYNTDKQDTFNLSLIASNGFCNDTISKSVTIWDFFTLNLPNAFTPNNDGKNDVFYPYGKNHVAKKYLFIIYNRWGNVVYESEVPYEGWDGTLMNNGSQCQEDTYVWKIITYDQFENKEKQRVGHVTLIR